MSDSSHKLSVYEKVGYSMGDAAANFVWRSTFFLPIFYTDTFGLAAAQVAILLLLVRLSDGVTDIIMGSIADRTETKNGKFRPWVIWTAPVVALFLALVFTTPDLSENGKLIYAYVIYFGLTLAYTANNVPYGALMGVMTPSVKERASLSGYRFAGAFGGGLLVMTLLPYLVDVLGDGDKAVGYKNTMLIFAVLLVAFCVITYMSTKERVKPVINTDISLSSELKDLIFNLPVILVPVAGVSIFTISLTAEGWSVEYGAAFCIASFIATLALRKWLINRPQEKRSHTQKDLADLLTNTPWLVLLIVGVMFGIFTVVRPSAAAYYFKYVLQREDLLSMYFFITLIASLAAALVTGHLARNFSKKGLMAAAFVLGAVSNGAIYFVKADQAEFMLSLAVVGEFFAGMLPVLFFSMLGDTADYSEWKNNRRATGLVYSAGTFINKTGHGFAGAIVMIVLASYGYDSAVESTIDESIEGMKQLMSIIPGIFAMIGAVALIIYPLNDKKLAQIEADLAERRKASSE